MRPLLAAMLLSLCILARPARADSRLRLLPSEITLTGPKAAQRLLAESSEAGQWTGDRTAQAVFRSSNPRVASVGHDGTVRPVSDGTTVITARVGAQTATAPVRVMQAKHPFVWSFRNHVLPMMTKAGCNGGSCHGAAAGKGGLKLSLRGFDPVSDYNVLTHQARGRRVAAGEPADSLMLLKPTMQVGHGGGERIKRGSPDFHVLSEWIAAGAPRPRTTDAALRKLEIFPPVSLLKPGETQQILVRADYSDGHSEDVTRWVKFGTSNGQTASVDDAGRVKVEGSGEAAVTVWFSSKVAFARIVSPYPGTLPAATFARAARFNLIDDPVLAKLQALGIPPSPLCTDAEFIRRVFLDAAGILPAPDEVRAFLADKSADKRAKLVERLLSRPEFVDYWTYKWSDLFLVNSRKLNGTALTSFYNYLRHSVAANKPWDRLAREMITATGSNLDNGAVNFYALHKEPIDQMETTTQAFLGMSLMCARCHNHPLEKWTQRDYYQMANLFARVRLKDGDRDGEVLVVSAPDGNINHPRLGIPLPPRPLDGKELALDDPQDRRAALADWLTSRENPYFAKAVVNRVWRNFMGRGIVEAEDDLRLTNPPSNQELLDALAQDFIANGYDVKHLIRLIVSSAAYQRSAVPVGINAQDNRYYSHYIVRRLPAEAMLDAISQVTGIPTSFDGYPAGTRALQLRDSQPASYFLDAFGRPAREQTCACERQQETNVAQALHLANGDTLNMKLRAPHGTIDRLLDSGASDDAVIDTLTLTALSRKPTAAERARFRVALAESKGDTHASKTGTSSRRQVIEDLFWAVLTNNEFLFNH